MPVGQARTGSESDLRGVRSGMRVLKNSLRSDGKVLVECNHGVAIVPQLELQMHALNEKVCE